MIIEYEQKYGSADDLPTFVYEDSRFMVSDQFGTHINNESGGHSKAIHGDGI